MKILVTGATGFLGRALVHALTLKSYSISTLVRRKCPLFCSDIEQLVCKDLSLLCSGEKIKLTDIDIVIHTAARVHIMHNEVNEPLIEYRKMNTAATIELARQAAHAGVKRFIFISSVKVNGENTPLNKPFTEDDKIIPTDPYGLSKYEAEQGLLRLAAETAMQVVIIRPPLIYGPHVKANFASMMKWVKKGLPLPLGSIHNKRSLVALDNLVDFIITCIQHPKASNEIFLISDGEDISTTELLIRVAGAFGIKAKLISIPTRWMIFIAGLLGKADMAKRLFASLQVDSSKATELLDWQPIITMEEQLKKTADAYLKNEKNV